MTPPNFPGRDDPAASASLAGQPRVLVVGAGAIGGVVEWGATNISPGHIAQTTRAPITPGRSGPGGQDLAGQVAAEPPGEWLVDVINGAVVAQAAAPVRHLSQEQGARHG